MASFADVGWIAEEEGEVSTRLRYVFEILSLNFWTERKKPHFSPVRIYCALQLTESTWMLGEGTEVGSGKEVVEVRLIGLWNQDLLENIQEIGIIQGRLWILFIYVLQRSAHNSFKQWKCLLCYGTIANSDSPVLLRLSLPWGSELYSFLISSNGHSGIPVIGTLFFTFVVKAPQSAKYNEKIVVCVSHLRSS